MAMNYQNFASLGVNLNRQKYGPLDISNVFTSAADLKYYLTKGAFTEGVSEYWYKNANEKIVPYPYEGQVLATVIDGVVSVYALSLDAEGNFQTQEIGAKVEVDGTTIVKGADGKLSIVAPVNPDDKKTYNFAYANGVYSWVEVDTATAAGQAQAIQGLTDRTVALEETVNGKAAVGEEGSEDYVPAVKGLVEKVTALEAVDNATQAELDAYKTEVSTAIANAEQAAKNYADGLAGNYDAAGSANTALESAKAYTDEEIAGLKVSIEQKEGVEYIVVKGKDDEEITSVNASKFVQDSFLNDVEYNAETGKVSFTWTMGDGSTKTDEIDIAHLVDTYTAGNGIKVENNEFFIDTTVVATVEALAGKVDNDTLDSYYTKTEVDGKGYAVATEVAGTYATKSELTEAVEGIENDLLAYAKTEDVNTELAKKVESATISHTTEEKAEGATVNGTQLDIVVDAFTKAETRQYVADTISQMTGGESAADVLLALNNYKSDNDERVGAVETKNGEQDTAIAKAQADATQGINDAKKVSDDLVTANAAIADNTREIGVVKDSISSVNTTLSGKIATLEGKDTEIAGKISGLETTVNGNATTIGEHTAAITALQNKDTELTGLISGVDAKFANYYDKDTVNTKVQEAIDAIPEVSFDGYATEKYVDDAILVVNEEVAKKANTADVYSKTDADAKFLTETQVKTVVDKVVADVTDTDTIEGLVTLVEYVHENAGDIAQLVSDVDANKTAIAANKVAHEKNAADIVAINESIAAIIQPKESSEISVATDGTLGIKEVNVNKLVQTEGDVFILNGGSSAN